MLTLTAKWVFMFCLPILLITVSISWAVNSLWLYKYDFREYNISQATGLTQAELETVATGLINYFNSGEEYISLPTIKGGKLFTPKETIHFRDVKGLVWLDYWVLLGTLIYSLAYAGVSLFWRRRKYWQQLARGVIGGAGITLVLMLTLGLGTLLNFDQLFLQFHLISFANKFWSAEGYMLLLFPSNFWYDAVLFCASITAGLAIVLSGIAGGYLLFTGRRAKS